VASPIIVDGRLWGAIIVATQDEPLPVDIEERLEKFTDIVATAIANADSRSELAASRRRIVAASDEARLPGRSRSGIANARAPLDDSRRARRHDGRAVP
jgi:GAF domain-containing protein